MGFQITKETNNNVDLKVQFDSNYKIYIEDKIIHAPLKNTLEDIKNIYLNVLEEATKQNIDTLELTIMHHTETHEKHIYSMLIELIEEFLTNNELNIYLNLEEFSSYYTNLRLDIYKEIDEFVNKEFEKNYKPYSYSSTSQIGVSQQMTDWSYEEFRLEHQLDELLANKTKSFGKRLTELIDEKGYEKDSDFYKKAMIDRRLFHNIITKNDYIPKKNTVILLALALELNEEDTKDFISYAGYAFSNSNKDQIIIYCIRNKYYNIMHINGYLYDKGLQPLLTIE